MKYICHAEQSGFLPQHIVNMSTHTHAIRKYDCLIFYFDVLNKTFVYELLEYVICDMCRMAVDLLRTGKLYKCGCYMWSTDEENHFTQSDYILYIVYCSESDVTSCIVYKQ